MFSIFGVIATAIFLFTSFLGSSSQPVQPPEPGLPDDASKFPINFIADYSSESNFFSVNSTGNYKKTYFGTSQPYYNINAGAYVCVNVSTKDINSFNNFKKNLDYGGIVAFSKMSLIHFPLDNFEFCQKNYTLYYEVCDPYPGSCSLKIEYCGTKYVFNKITFSPFPEKKFLCSDQFLPVKNIMIGNSDLFDLNKYKSAVTIEEIPKKICNSEYCTNFILLVITVCERLSNRALSIVNDPPMCKTYKYITNSIAINYA